MIKTTIEQPGRGLQKGISLKRAGPDFRHIANRCSMRTCDPTSKLRATLRAASEAGVAS
jgi:hypothetical protein